MSRVEENKPREDNKKSRRKTRRRGWLVRIGSFVLDVICGMILLTLVVSYSHGINVWDTLKAFFPAMASVQDSELSPESQGMFGCTAADFENAVLGEEEWLKKLEVYSRDVSDVATLTQTGLGKIKAFSKYQYITYHGKAVYTVDLSGLKKKDITLDEESKTVTITVPDVVLEPINIPSENIEFGEVKRNSIFAFGDMKIKPEDQAKVETRAKKKMAGKLEEENAIDDARIAADHAIWEIFQPVISGVSPEYALRVTFESPEIEK